MKQLFILTGCAFLFACATGNEEGNLHACHKIESLGAESYIDSLEKGLITKDTLKGSPLRVTMVNLEQQHIHLAYSSPGVKNRVVWGGLVPYQQVWVTGAHKATTISFTSPVVIQGKQIPEGMYALFTIPDSSSWTVILNKRYDQHLADEYQESEDVWRGQVTPVQLEKPVERLRYKLTKKDKQTAVLTFEWERKQVQLEIANETKP